MRQRHTACTRNVKRLRDEGSLAPGWRIADAADVLWELSSIRTWEDLTRDRGWTKQRYTRLLQRVARRALITGAPDGQVAAPEPPARREPSKQRKRQQRRNTGG